MGMPNWTPGPWITLIESTRLGPDESFYWSVTTVPEPGEVPEFVAVSDGDIGGDVDKGLSNARLIAQAPTMVDALAQWMAAEATGDETEMQNARAERDRILAELTGDE